MLYLTISQPKAALKMEDVVRLIRWSQISHVIIGEHRVGSQDVALEIS